MTQVLIVRANVGTYADHFVSGCYVVTFPPNPFNRAYENSGWSRRIERG